MISKANNYFVFHLCVSVLVLLQGCVAIQSFPTVARGGDTITLAVGSAEGMKKDNTTATFISDVDSSSVNLQIRAIIRLRPDQTSKVALFDAFVNAEDSFTAHSQWITVLVIDLPVGLTVGAGHIDIQSTASYGTLSVGINDIPISIDIIAGTGAPNEFWYNNNFGGESPGDLSSLEALTQVVFKVTPAANTLVVTKFAAAEIKVNVPMDSVFGPGIRVVADDFYTKNSKDNLQVSWVRNGADYTVNILSPKKRLDAKRLRFSVVTELDKYIRVPGPLITSVKIFDIDGFPISLVSGVPNEEHFTIGIE